MSQHTVSFWVQSFTSDLRKVTKEHGNLRTYGLGLGLDNFRVIALTGYFRKLDVITLQNAYQRWPFKQSSGLRPESEKSSVRTHFTMLKISGKSQALMRLLAAFDGVCQAKLAHPSSMEQFLAPKGP